MTYIGGCWIVKLNIIKIIIQVISYKISPTQFKVVQSLVALRASFVIRLILIIFRLFFHVARHNSDNPELVPHQLGGVIICI